MVSEPPTPPEATCTAVARLSGDIDCGIWTNYVTDNGVALLAALKQKCAGLTVSAWTVGTNADSYKAADGTEWTTNQIFDFSLSSIGRESPAELACLQAAIIAAGGPSNAPEYPFAAVLNPPS
jgi:hypothetical protein